jgi:hypothetical protein
MAALRTVVSKRATVIFLIAILLVVHLLLVHPHDEPSALEACVVLLGSAILAFLLAVIPRSDLWYKSVIGAAGMTVQPRLISRTRPSPVGTVMRH